MITSSFDNLTQGVLVVYVWDSSSDLTGGDLSLYYRSSNTASNVNLLIKDLRTELDRKRRLREFIDQLNKKYRRRDNGAGSFATQNDDHARDQARQSSNYRRLRRRRPGGSHGIR